MRPDNFTDNQAGPSPGTGLSIVVCAKNESKTVAGVLQQLHTAYPDAEIILVDNGSTDDTAQLALAVEGTRVVSETAAGKGNAMRAGANVATKEWLLFHDADGEYMVEDSIAVVRGAKAANACGIGVRLVSYSTILPSSWLANGLIRSILRWKTRQDIPDVLTGTRCLTVDLFKELATTSSHFGIETEIARKVALRGVVSVCSPVRFVPRSTAAGKKIRPWHLLALVFEAFRGPRALR